MVSSEGLLSDLSIGMAHLYILIFKSIHRVFVYVNSQNRLQWYNFQFKEHWIFFPYIKKIASGSPLLGK